MFHHHWRKFLLQQKAKRIRYSEKRWAVRSKLDETELSLGNIVDVYMLKPIKMTLVEPALTLINIYMGRQSSYC